MKNFYQVLGLEPTCSAEQIKSAFKEYAKHFHPDKHQGNEFFAQKFIEVKEAYDNLYNPATRNVHDEYHGLNDFSSSQYNQTQEGGHNSNSSQTSSSTAKESQNDNSKKSNTSNNSNREVTEEDYCKWAEQKLNNNDYPGALGEIGDGMKKFRKSAKLEYAEGDIQEAFGYYWRARKSYRRAFEYGIVEAKAEVIRIESLLESGIEIYKKYMVKAVLFCSVGIAIAISSSTLHNLVAGVIAGTIVNCIGTIIILRGVNKELPKRLTENFQYVSFEFNVYMLFTMAMMMGSSFLAAYIYG